MKLKITLFFICFLCFQYYSICQWEWHHPYPQGHTLHDIYFADSDHAWACGKYGTIIYTDNGGQSWNNQQTKTYYTNYTLYSIFFLDLQTGWACGSGGTIFRTNNGGQTWEDISTPCCFNFYSIHFINELEGWVSVSGFIRHTTDGGDTWHSQDTGNFTYYFDVYFSDNLIGCAVGNEGVVALTNDGGESWYFGNSPSTNTLNDLFFVDDSKVWAVGMNGTIQYSIDGGINWVIKNSGTNQDLYSIYFTDINEGWATGGTSGYYAESIILHTTDMGETWTAFDPGLNTKLNAVSFGTDQNGFCVGENGAMAFTFNGGEYWFSHDHLTNEDLEFMYFLDDQNGWIIGKYSDILHTSDGGENWTINNVDATYLNTLFFIDENIGWATGQDFMDEIILKTLNGGEDWYPVYSSSSGPSYYSIYFIDENIGLVGGYNGTLKRTMDGGSTWTDKSLNTNHLVKDFYFINQYEGWCFTYSYPNNEIYKTYNGGSTWESIFYGDFMGFWQIHMVNSSMGWAITGITGELYYTDDGGHNWDLHPIHPEADYQSLFFTNADKGWIAGRNGEIFATTDGGQTWLDQSVNTYIDFWQIIFTSSFEGWIIGEEGAIFHTTNGGIISGIEKETTKTDLNVLTYPNPFKQSTTIQLNLESASHVKIDILNNQGQEIEMLLNQTLEIGEHKIRWNATGNQPGVYYTRITENGLSQTQKIILLNF